MEGCEGVQVSPCKKHNPPVETVAGRGGGHPVPNLLVTNIAAYSSMGRYVFSSNGDFKRKPSTHRIPVRGVYDVYIYIIFAYVYSFPIYIYKYKNIYILIHILPLSSCNLLHDVCFFLKMLGRFWDRSTGRQRRVAIMGPCDILLKDIGRVCLHYQETLEWIYYVHVDVYFLSNFYQALWWASRCIRVCLLSVEIHDHPATLCIDTCILAFTL